MEKKEPRIAGLKTAVGVLFLVLVTCFLALLSVNSDIIIFHYLFAGFNCLQGPFIFFFRVVLNKEARMAMKFCCSHKRPDHVIKSKASIYKCNTNYKDGKLYHIPFADSSISLNGTMQSGKSQQSYVPFVLRDDGLSNSQAQIALNDHIAHFPENKNPEDHDSDSDSDLSLEDDHSESYASTHSSDSEDEEGPLPPEECWENLASSGAKRPSGQDNGVMKTYWPDYPGSGSDSEIKDRLRTDLGNSESNLRTIPEARIPESTSVQIPGLSHLSTHPHRGILKKKQLSPIVERNGRNRINSDLVEAVVSSHGSSSSEGRPGPTKPTLQDQLNGVVLSIKAGTVDGDSSGSDHCNTSM